MAETDARAGDQRLSVAALQAWEQLGFGMFIHFGLSTFVAKELPSGNDPSTTYAPDRLDVDQWIQVARDTGMKYAVLTTKHVSGHCLWPSAQTDYHVGTSGNTTDVVDAFVTACRRHGLMPGFYYCSWDNHHRFGSRTWSDLLPGGLVESPRVDFPDVLRTAADAGINEGNMFFWTFGAGHGIIEYFDLTGNEQVRQALVATADDALADGRIGLRLKAVAFAARHADDPAPYREAIREWAEGEGRRSLLQIVPHNAEYYSGPRAMLRGSTPGALFTMNDLPYVIGLIDADPPMDDELRRIDESGGPFQPEPTLSWQSEYDLPEFEEYLRIRHPQP